MKLHIKLFSMCLLLVISSSFFAESAESKGLLDYLTFKRAPTVTRELSSVPNAKDFVSAQILIRAPRDIVWQTIHDERTSAPDLVYSKIIEEHDNTSVIEQRWNIVHFLKTSSCTMTAEDHPNDRIDFKLLKSDEFKVMQGSWILTDRDDVSSTLLELTTYFQLRRFGSEKFVKLIARGKMAKRLEHIKKLAEETQESRSGLDVKGKLL